jgi:hypothetical protein
MRRQRLGVDDPASVSELHEDLSAAAGLRPLGRPDFCHWSPGVQVAFEHFRLA